MSDGNALCESIMTEIFVVRGSMPSVTARNCFSSQKRQGPKSSPASMALLLRYPSSQ